jgi:hypothetical protein
VRAVIERSAVTDEELTGLVGPPFFRAGSSVTGDLAALGKDRVLSPHNRERS